MRSLLLFLVACTSTRQLAGTDALQLAGHRQGWVVPTTERWHERIDPLTSLQFQRADGAWSEVVHGYELSVDRDGAWILQTRGLGYLADEVEIDEVGGNVGDIIAAARPKTGLLHIAPPDADHLTSRYRISAPRHDLDAWLDAIVLEVARLDPIDRVPILGLEDDAAKLYQLRVVHEAAALGHWRLSAHARTWVEDLRGKALADATTNGFTARVGWRWNDIAKVEVTNVSGGKTLAAIIGYSALAVAVAPFALFARGISFPAGGHGGGGGGGGNLPIGGGDGSATHTGTWDPDPINGVAAASLFSTGAKVRAWIQPTLAFDSSLAYRGDLLATGATAKLRIGQLWEIGGGVREALSHDRRATMGVFATGLHLPLDAGMKLAIPVGFEVASGGGVSDLRFPIGLRYSTEHWFVTASPATPEYLHTTGSPRRWSWVSTLELGYAF